MQNERPPEPPNTPQTIQTEADAQAVQDITQRLNEITRRANCANALVILGFFWLFLCVSLMTIIPLSLFEPNDPRSVGCFLMGSVGIICGIPYTEWASRRSLNAVDVTDIAVLGGVQAIGPLFSALQDSKRKGQKQAIRSALAILLPQIKASDAHLLTPLARRTIHKWLYVTFETSAMNRYSPPLRLAALKALEQVGNASDLPIVERLANMKPRTYSEEKLKHAAIECLPMLLARCEDVEAKQTLLRASQAEPTDPATLLRPASHSPETNPAELLRGSHSPRHEGNSGG